MEKAILAETLKLIKNTFQKANWFVEGYIQSLSWNLKTKILLEYLEIFIKDRAFLKLIWTYLKFANEQNVKYVNIFTKSSFQRPNLSIMLNNIYLNQFDIWLNNLSLIALDQKNFKCFSMGNRREKKRAQRILVCLLFQ